MAGRHSRQPAAGVALAVRTDRGSRLRPIAAAGISALLIVAVAGWSLVRLSQLGVTPWSSLLLVLLIALAAVSALGAVVVRGRYLRGAARVWPVLAVAATLLLSLIGLLTRLSLGLHGQAAWSQLAAVLGIAAFFAAVELAIRFRTRAPFRAACLGAAFLIALQYAGGPGRNAVIPGETTAADWPGPFLAIAILAVLATAAGGQGSRFAAAGRAGWPPIPAAARKAFWLVLPGGAALGFFAITRDFGAAIALFVACLAVCAQARGSLAMAATSVVSFGLGCLLITLMGTELGYPHFTARAVLEIGARSPYALFLGQNMMLGPGFGYRKVGVAGYGRDLLVVIGRETGVAGLAGVGLVFMVLIVALFMLARRQTRPAFPGPALAYGLAWLVTAQVVLAALTLLRWIPPLAGGPPLLAGGAPGYVAVLVGTGIVIGLAWRTSEPAGNADGIRPRITRSCENQSEATTS